MLSPESAIVTMKSIPIGWHRLRIAKVLHAGTSSTNLLIGYSGL